MPTIEYRLAGEIPFLVFPQLTAAGLAHGVFTRGGGVSAGPYHTLNAGFGVGDAAAHVRENRKRIKQALGIERLVSASQVHGDAVLLVDVPVGVDQELNGYDALITAIPGVALMVQQADCQAVLLYDPARPAVGIAHAGWRGSVANIIAKTVTAMVDAFGTEPRNLMAAVSPSLGPCCAEFINYRTELPEALHRYQVRDTYFDFWAVSRDQLIATGVRPERITIAGLCTVCEPRFFSYRRNRHTGRFASVIALRPDNSP